ncbi:MAG: cytochrome c [Lysobacterales bacterium]|jgi:hypothetical protein
MRTDPPSPLCRPLVALLVILAAPQWALAAGTPTPSSPETLWMLNCQGCHRAGGQGTANAVPALKDVVARFLSVPGGRQYLIRVPGVAGSPLADAPLSEVVNWMLKRFDPQDIPPDFKPYTADEVAAYRKMGAYGDQAGTIRATLTASFTSPAPAKPQP